MLISNNKHIYIACHVLSIALITFIPSTDSSSQQFYKVGPIMIPIQRQENWGTVRLRWHSQWMAVLGSASNQSGSSPSPIFFLGRVQVEFKLGVKVGGSDGCVENKSEYSCVSFSSKYREAAYHLFWVCVCWSSKLVSCWKIHFLVVIFFLGHRPISIITPSHHRFLLLIRRRKPWGHVCDIPICSRNACDGSKHYTFNRWSCEQQELCHEGQYSGTI